MEIFYLFLAALLGGGFSYWLIYKLRPIKEETINHEVREQNRLLQGSVASYRQEEQLRREEVEKLNLDIIARREQLENTITQEASIVQSIQDREMERANEAFTAYIDSLDLAYTQTEEEFDSKIAGIRIELDKMRATRAAGIEAALREKEILEKQDFYKVSLTRRELEDIEILEDIKPRISRPEVLSKLIWTTYYQKQITTLCGNVIGSEKKIGIYKITDTLTGLAYIGQSVDIAQRWKDHVKTALGAGASSSSNKLYSAMQESGVYNFTFEVLEICPAIQLNEKERTWIDHYQSNVYGLNTVKGVNK